MIQKQDGNQFLDETKALVWGANSGVRKYLGTKFLLQVHNIMHVEFFMCGGRLYSSDASITIELITTRELIR